MLTFGIESGLPVRHSDADTRTDRRPVYAWRTRRSHEKHLPTFLRFQSMQALIKENKKFNATNSFPRWTLSYICIIGFVYIWFFVCMAVCKPTGVGVGMVLFSMLLSSYYSVVMSWAMLYLGSSFTPVLPWTHCNNTWNTEWCRQGASIPPSSVLARFSRSFYCSQEKTITVWRMVFDQVRCLYPTAIRMERIRLELATFPHHPL